MLSLGGLAQNPTPDEVWRRLDGSSILITGASGLVGLNLLAALVGIRDRLGLELEIISVSKSGVLPGNILHGVGIKFFSGDLLNSKIAGSLPDADWIVHGATYGQPAKFTKDSFGTLMLNSEVTATLLKKCRHRFLFLSSSEVYSGLPPARHKETEIGTTGPLHPRAAYIEAKRFGETLTLNGFRGSQVANIARLSLAYGPGARTDDQRVLNELILRGLKEGSVELRGGNEQVRSYLFAEDAVSYLLRILVLGTGEIYNVGGLESLTLGELAELIAADLGLEHEFVPGVAGNAVVGAPNEVRIDMSKTRKLTGEFEHYPVELGLRATSSWYRDLVACEQISDGKGSIR